MANVESILHNSSIALQDNNGHIRWPLSELFAYLTDGLLELQGILSVMRPEEFLETRTHNLAAGPEQSVDGVKAVKRVWVNVDRSDPSIYGMAVKAMSPGELTVFNPNWPSAGPSKDVVNYALDPLNENRFWVYPQSDGTGAVRVDVELEPKGIDVTPTGSGDELSDYDIPLPVRDIFAPALTYYVLHRAWAKDADYAGNINVSDRYYSLFKEAIRVRAGAEIRAEAREQGE